MTSRTPAPPRDPASTPERAASERMLAHDRIADQFDAVMNEYDVGRRLDVLFGEFLGDCNLRGLRILDAGCGTGRMTTELTRRGGVVTALDYGRRLVEYTKRHCCCQPVVGSILRLPFADKTFDVVLSTEVIEHVPDPEAAVRELCRVLMPDGHLALSTPNWIWQAPVRIASSLKLRPYDGLENFVKPSRLRAVAEDAGLRVLEHRGIHLLPFQLRAIHSILRYMDRYGSALLPVMINQCLHGVKSPRR